MISAQTRYAFVVRKTRLALRRENGWRSRHDSNMRPTV
jgi:hypothetical protein